jgi:hypothetical protein
MVWGRGERSKKLSKFNRLSLETVHGTTTTEVNMPELERAMFAGTEQPQAADWASLFTTNLERQHMEELLEAHGWTGETNAIIGVKLTPDNTKVNTARLILVGAWGEGPVRIQAQKVWPTAAENLLLEVNLGDMSLFRFPDGEMASHYVPGDATKNSIIIAGQDGTQRAMEEDERETPGIGEFCLRANCYMAKSTSAQEGVWLATTILIYPGTEDGMVDKCMLTHKASWPGIKLAEGDICLRLQAREEQGGDER